MLVTTLAGAVAGACYSPELRDCVVACTAPSDCATGQVCGADRFCAAPSIAGSCDELAAPTDGGADAELGPDAARPPSDAPPPPPPVDAGPTPDAPPPPPPPLVELRVKINGIGKVVVVGIGTCATPGVASTTECLFAVPRGNVLLQASAGPGWRFDKWTEGGCQGQGTTCTTAVLEPSLVQAKFKQGDDDDD